ncbi:DUF6412 domain-containing protein [Streptomyces noursei]|uniref:DUF6412 domain-containing protein n=1 Tax=Streptomyces noursei TaxID=1971 RepID=UPI001678DE97|nr:DUF6412 domain-containing protein [Streptomyces noursei]MCZ1016002.1 DUF6412 domain-containing protein [Streptomyces noursei]GGW92294.1 hypothetical protein GCM10010341_12000 [Streptomyces noursei]
MYRIVEAWRLYTSALFFLLAELLLEQSGLTTSLAAAATTAAVLLLLCSALALAAVARPVPPGRIRTAIRDRERRTAFLPQRDPDAAGRPRPRAPGRALPAAA